MKTNEEHAVRCERFAHAVEDAILAFWETIHLAYPEAVSGDLDPLTTYEFDNYCENVVADWCDENVPEWQED